MKKFLIVLSSLLVLGFNAGAQEFVPGFYLQGKVGDGMNWGEAGKFYNTGAWEFAGAAGYQFTPVFGLRLDASLLRSTSISEQNFHYHWYFVQPALDATFDLRNLFGGYKLRAFNPYAFVGAGFNYAFDNKAFVIKNEIDPWEGSILSFSPRFGLGADYYIKGGWAITGELAGNILPDELNSALDDKKDFHAAAYLGFKYNFGRAKAIENAKNADAAALAAAAAAAEKAARLAAEKAAADRAAAEKAAAEKAAAEKAAAERAAAEKAAAERAAARSSANNVLFVIGQTNIRDNQKDKVQNTIDILNAYPEAIVVISGYADKQTGTASWNRTLSKRRAENVAKALVDAGIDPSRITTEYYGSDVNPFDTPAENRVAVSVTR